MQDTVVLVITDGRWGCFRRTVDSFLNHTNAYLDMVIVDDSADPSYTKRIMEFCPDATVLSAPSRRGFTGAIRDVFDIRSGMIEGPAPFRPRARA